MITLAAPDIARRAKPGQFVNVRVRGTHTLLRRPFSLARSSQRRPAPGTIQIVFDAHGPGTEWLAQVSVHDHIDVVGPLGNSFGLPREESNCLLVGGGYGVAPLLLLAEQLRAARHRVDFAVGARSKDRLYAMMEAKRTSAAVAFTTEDGSFGTKGRITDILPEMIAKTETDVLYACGPMPMLEAVGRVAADLGIRHELAVEEHMACGVGVCWTCVLPVADARGEVANRRVCMDGPIFDGDRIDWDASRYGPKVAPAASPAATFGSAVAALGAAGVADETFGGVFDRSDDGEESS